MNLPDDADVELAMNICRVDVSSRYFNVNQYFVYAELVSVYVMCLLYFSLKMFSFFKNTTFVN